MVHIVYEGSDEAILQSGNDSTQLFNGDLSQPQQLTLGTGAPEMQRVYTNNSQHHYLAAQQQSPPQQHWTYQQCPLCQQGVPHDHDNETEEDAYGHQ